MTDEGMFHPPGAPGGELEPWRPPAPPPAPPPPPAPRELPPGRSAVDGTATGAGVDDEGPGGARLAGHHTGYAGTAGARTASAGSASRPSDGPTLVDPPANDGAPDGPSDTGGTSGTHGTGRGPGNLPLETAWRLGGVAAAVGVYLSAGLAWYHSNADFCARYQVQLSNPKLLGACGRGSSSGWETTRFGVWLALAAGVLLLIRLARRGLVAFDFGAIAAVGAADLLMLRALTRGSGDGVSLTWPGPLTMLPLAGLLTVAAVQAFRVTQQSSGATLRETGTRARQELADHPPRLPGWLRPAQIRRRRGRWLAAAGVVAAVFVVHSCAKDGPLGGLGGTQQANTLSEGQSRPSAEPDPQGQSGGSGHTGGPTPTPTPSPAGPDGVTLLTDARSAVAGAKSATVKIENLVGGPNVKIDLQLTSDGQAQGSITTPKLRIYLVRRIGPRCWVRNMESHDPTWVPVCAIQAGSGAPALDIAKLTDWTIMVGSLPDPADARVAAKAEQLDQVDGEVWRVTAADGSTVYVPSDPDTAQEPRRIISAKPRAGATQIDYSNWNTPVSVTPPS